MQFLTDPTIEAGGPIYMKKCVWIGANIFYSLLIGLSRWAKMLKRLYNGFINCLISYALLLNVFLFRHGFAQACNQEVGNRKPVGYPVG